jgi:16S rRNA (adenine1518-N6/adenine1519-N6)-dimethyltransferase
LLADLGISPRKAWGQNFLIDKNILDTIVAAADLGREDGVLEIGPGLGVLTESLVRKAARVVAVEKDAGLCAYLAKRFEGEPVLDLIRADMLDLDVDALLGPGICRVVSNLPFATGTRILVELVMAASPPEHMVVTVQQEVAGRLAAGPGDRERGRLGIWAQLSYAVELVKTVSPTCFWPKPEVQAAVVRMVRHAGPGLSEGERRVFYELTKRVFTHRRKQLGSCLTRAAGALELDGVTGTAWCRQAGVDARARPEDLEIDDWCRLVRSRPRAG